MALIFSLIIVLFFYFNFYNPTYFLILYIIVTTKFLGYMDFSSINVGGFEVGLFLINILTTLLAFHSSTWVKQKKDQLKLKAYVTIVIFLLIYGIVRPLFLDVSNLTQSFIASKEFWYYSILIYVAVNKNRIGVSKIIQFVKLLGLYLALMSVLGILMPTIVAPLYYLDTDVRVAYPTYIVLAIFLFVADYKLKGFNFFILFKILFCTVGLIFTNRLSLNFTTISGVLLLIYGIGTNLKLLKFNIIKITILLCVFIFFGLVLNLQLIFNTYELILSVVDGSVSSLASRDIYNDFRIQAISQNKWFGYGFIHHSSGIMILFDSVSSNRFMKSFGVIDSGYIDLLIKFGWLGLITYLYLFFNYIYSSFKSTNKSIHTLSMSIFLATYFLVNYTWSVFTYPIGIVAMAVAVLIIHKGVELKKINI